MLRKLLIRIVTFFRGKVKFQCEECAVGRYVNTGEFTIDKAFGFISITNFYKCDNCHDVKGISSKQVQRKGF